MICILFWNISLNSSKISCVFRLQIVDIENIFPAIMIFNKMLVKSLRSMSIKLFSLDTTYKAVFHLVNMSFMILRPQFTQLGNNAPRKYRQKNQLNYVRVRNVKQHFPVILFSLLVINLEREKGGAYPPVGGETVLAGSQKAVPLIQAGFLKRLFIVPRHNDCY